MWIEKILLGDTTQQAVDKINKGIKQSVDNAEDISNIKDGTVTVGEANQVVNNLIIHQSKYAMTELDPNNVGETTANIFNGSSPHMIGDRGHPIGYAATAFVAKHAERDSKNNVIDETYATKEQAQAAQDKADSAYALAEDKSRAFVFDTEADMIEDLQSADSTKYNIGDHLLIRAIDVPDYWVSAKSVDGDTVIYDYSILETSKVDLTDYVTKDDLNAHEYVLPVASSTTLGGIKSQTAGTDGTDYPVEVDSEGHAKVNVKTNTFTVTENDDGTVDLTIT